MGLFSCRIGERVVGLPDESRRSIDALVNERSARCCNIIPDSILVESASGIAIHFHGGNIDASRDDGIVAIGIAYFHANFCLIYRSIRTPIVPHNFSTPKSIVIFLDVTSSRGRIRSRIRRLVEDRFWGSLLALVTSPRHREQDDD